MWRQWAACSRGTAIVAARSTRSLERMRNSRGALILLASVGVPVAVVAAWWWVTGSARAESEAFYGIAQNAPRSVVVAKMGAPSVTRKCGSSLWWGDDSQYRGKNDGRCVTEERYERFLTAYGVGYSAEGRVVSKYRYTSE